MENLYKKFDLKVLMEFRKTYENENCKYKNEKPLPTSGGLVYPITKEKNKIFDTSTHHSLNQLTEYYDTETRGFKKQSKIIFNLKIISPKLDEIAKDQNVESGIEDSDEEPSRPCPKKKMKKI